MRRCLTALLAGAAALGGWGTVNAAAPVPADLAAQLSYPFLDNLVAAEHGGRIAWTSNVAGLRTVWTAAGPDYRPHSVATTGKDDGQELTGLVLSPDGQAMAWTRGGDHDANWEAKGGLQPDPGSPTTQAQTEIWLARAGGPAVKLADGDAPALSATGRLAYLKDGAVWTVPTAGKGKAERLFFDRGKDADLAWSPDGSRLLFTSNRGDHSFVGLWLGADKPILWLAPSTGHDADPVWSPDGTRVAFSRTPGDGGAPEPLLQEVPHPWSLWVADAASGEGRRVWASPRDLTGSYPDVPGGLYLRWAAGNRVVFRAEMDGWPHLYAVPAAGGEATLLTPGAFMVDRPSLSPDRQSVLFDANTGATPGDEDRRHVMRVAVDRPGAIPITRGEGIESGAVTVGAQVAFLSATATRPPSLHIMQGDGAGDHVIDAIASSYPSSRLIVPKPVTFRAADGLLVHGQLFASPGGGLKPGVIFVHGGPPRQMLLGWSYMDYYANAYAVNQYLATHGFVVLSVNYRLGIGYGRAYQHPAYGGPAGSSEYQDVVAGARFLQRQPGVDGNCLGIWGGSYGGLLTALALARNSDLFKAGVDFHGVHDWSRDIADEQEPPKRYERGDWDRFLKVAFDSSPVAAVSGWRSPVLFIHGDDDRNVRFNQTIDLERRLDALGRPYEELVFPDEIHGFLRSADWLRADAATIDFLQRTLKP